jgi:MFS family permease
VPSSPSSHDSYAALRFREFNFFVAARFLLTVAIQIQSTVVGWQIYDLTKDALSLGLIGLAEAIPFMSVILYAGHLADLINRKKIIILSLMAYFSGALLLLLFTWNLSWVIEAFGVAPIYVVICLIGVARGFAGPSFSSMVVQLVPRELYANAVTWNSTVWQVAAVSGPALGGLLYGFAGITSAYLTVVVLIALSLSLITLIAARPVPQVEIRESLKTRLRNGISFVFNNQVLLSALSLDLFAVFFGGAVALLPIFASEVLGVGPEGLGLLRAAPALGSALMGLVLAHRPPLRNSGRKLLVYVAGFGVCIILFALSRNFYLSLLLLALSGALDSISVVIRGTILQLLTPDEMRGRVSAVNSIFVGSSNEIGSFESGVTARLLGLVPAVVFGGSMTVLVVAVTAWTAPRLRALHLKDLV